MDTNKPFSIRVGAKAEKIVLQTNGMDERLKNKLWNIYYIYYLKGISNLRELGDGNSTHRNYFFKLWYDFFSLPVNMMPGWASTVCYNIQTRFFSLNWNEIYEFLEFTINNYEDGTINDNFIKVCNHALETEKSAYRISGNLFVPLMGDEESYAVKDALSLPMIQPAEHLKKAIKLFSNREDPDYANSIKESISAVESLCRLIGKNEMTLGDGINKIAPQLGISDILKQSLSKMYGYANVEPGTRHGATEPIKVDFDDAKFFLVACSGWMNYLYGKAIKTEML